MGEIYSLKPGTVFRVAFKENDKRRKKRWCESEFLEVADCDVRKGKDRKDGKIHLVFSIPVDHPNGDGDIVGEIRCCFNKDITPDELKAYIRGKSKAVGEDENYFIDVIRKYVGLDKGVEDYKWYESFSDYQFDYDYYLKEEI